MNIPKVGEIQDGYRYAGGDPSSKTSWSWVGDGTAAARRPPEAQPVDAGTKTDQDALQGLRDQAGTALNVAQQADRFMALNKTTATGPGAALPVIPFIPKFMGDSPTWGGVLNAGNPNYQAMKSIASAVAPHLRPPGSGSSSDKDTKTYFEAFPGVGNLGDTNKLISGRIREQSDQAAAKAAFMDKWFSIRGNLLGADQAFTSYLRNKGAAPAPGAQRAAPAQAAGGLSPKEQAELAALRQRFGKQ